MLPGPVFNVELLTLSRRGRYYALRFVYGLVFLAIVWMNDPLLYRYPPRDANRLLTIQELADVGQSIFMAIVWTQSLAILFITPALVAGVIAEERQRKTLSYLLASCLSSGEIVVGKLAARLLLAAVLIVVGMPVVALLGLVGGVDPDAVLFFFGGSLTSTFFLGALAIAISTHSRKPREAVWLAYLATGFWLLVPSLITVLFPWAGGYWLQAYEWVKPVNEWVAASSPVHLMMTVGMRPQVALGAVLWMMGLQVAYGMLLLGLAVHRLRPASRKEGGGATRARGRLHLFPRPACGDYPIPWKECLVNKTALSTQVATALVFLIVVGLMVYFSADEFNKAFWESMENGYSTSGAQGGRDNYNGVVRTVLTLVYILMGIGMAGVASSGLSGEREEDTWVSLVATPLTAGEILFGKMLGAFWAMRWLGLVWAVFAVSGLIVGAVHPVGFLAAVLLTVIYLTFANALGTAYSLRARSSARALTSTIGTLMVVNFVYMLLLIPFNNPSPVCFFGFTPMFEAMSLVTYREFDGLFGSGGRVGVLRNEDFPLAGLCSAFAYSVGTFALIVNSYTTFDRVIDRPSTTGGTPMPKKPAGLEPEFEPVGVSVTGDLVEAKPLDAGETLA